MSRAGSPRRPMWLGAAEFQDGLDSQLPDLLLNGELGRGRFFSRQSGIRMTTFALFRLARAKLCGQLNGPPKPPKKTARDPL